MANNDKLFPEPRDALIDAVKAGLPFNKTNLPLPTGQLGPVIEARLIRQLVLGLAKDNDGATCHPTPAGIEIHDATIAGRIELDKVVGFDGGSVVPIEFFKCHFEDGFSGAHGKFSRLSFRDCSFGGRVTCAPGEQPKPTIELTDAHIDGDLDMEGIRPGGVTSSEGRREDELCLWIRAVGAKINGKVELSRSLLRAPEEARVRAVCDEAVAALNLTLADIKGDVRILCGARFEGGMRLRGAHVAGDVWMRGAFVKGETSRAADDDALFMQGVHIGGFLMMDGGWDKTGGRGAFHRFRCAGDINLTSAEVGRSLYLDDAVVQGSVIAPDIIVRDDVVLGAAVDGDIDLADCEIVGSLYLSRLTVAPSASKLSLRDGNIGKSLTLVPGPANYSLIEARRTELRCLPGVELIEGLWRHIQRGDGRTMLDDYHLVQSAFLKHGSKIWALDGRASVFQLVIETVGHKLDPVTAEEYLRLHCHWCYSGNGLFRLDVVGPARPRGEPTAPSWTFDVSGTEGDIPTACSITIIAREKNVEVVRGECHGQSEPKANAPRFAGGLLLHPPAPRRTQHRVQEGGWVVGPTLRDMVLVKRPTRLVKLESVLTPHIHHRVLLGGVIDLENLSCDMLDDHAGRAWGGDFSRIAMNHFSYRRASWSYESDEGAKPTDKRFRSWFGRNWVDWVWPLWLPWPLSWKKRAMHWEGWQSRRNWIYRQFPRDPKLPYTFRHKIGEVEYRPQPFEQAIGVARAEGRESFAINFEMLKRRIEWRLFNLRSRWWLGVVGFIAAHIWVLLHGGHAVPVLTSLFATLAIMMWVSFFHRVLSKMFKWQWGHHSLMFLLFMAPAILLYLVDGWMGHPLHFAIAILIFATIRSLSWFADLILRAGFGYLRRPLRAIVALTLVFLIGWVGVDVANNKDMFVVDAEPVASLVLRHGDQELMGSEGRPNARRDISCRPTLIEPLYALDVLVPLIDLREESRCEVRRLPKPGEREAPGAAEITSLGVLWRDVPELTVRNHHFWAVMKVLYAIVGWFIVSLALLTFTQVNRTQEEAWPEGRGR